MAEEPLGTEERTVPHQVGITDRPGQEIVETVFALDVAGDKIEGILQDVRPFRQQQDKEGEQSGRRYRLRVGDAEYVIFGSAELNRKLETAMVGNIVRVELKGREKLEGGRTLKRFKVEIVTVEKAEKPA